MKYINDLLAAIIHPDFFSEISKSETGTLVIYLAGENRILHRSYFNRNAPINIPTGLTNKRVDIYFNCIGFHDLFIQDVRIPICETFLLNYELYAVPKRWLNDEEDVYSKEAVQRTERIIKRRIEGTKMGSAYGRM